MIQSLKKLIIPALFLVLVFLSAEIVRSPKTDSAQIYFLNVGQGDAELIQKNNYQILIDGGPDDSILAELGKIMPISDREIEMVILSHPHADHLTGLNLVLDRYKVDKIYATGILDTTNGYLEFLNKIKEKQIDFVVPEIGARTIPFENSRLEFIWPGTKYKGEKIDNLNNSSLVAKFCYLKNCALFAGDAEQNEQVDLFQYYSDKNQLASLKSEIYKLPHHGSSNGVYENLISAISPKFGLIEVGKDNNYGHPHQSTLDLYQKLKIPLFRTDIDGTVKFNLDEGGVSKD